MEEHKNRVYDMTLWWYPDQDGRIMEYLNLDKWDLKVQRKGEDREREDEVRIEKRRVLGTPINRRKKHNLIEKRKTICSLPSLTLRKRFCCVRYRIFSKFTHFCGKLCEKKFRGKYLLKKIIFYFLTLIKKIKYINKF